MTKRFIGMVCVLSLLGLIGFAGVHTSAQETKLAKPAAPLLLTGGANVQVAWSLPDGPKLETVVIYRTSRSATQFIELGRVSPKQLTFTDANVELGRTYQYRIQTLRGFWKSEMSDVASVTVGGTARIAFLGGSPQRAVFEVTLYREGQRISERFVHSPGEPIGDLAYVASLKKVQDFRIGPVLESMKIGDSVANEIQLATLLNPDGQPMLAPDGDEIELEFEAPGREHETLIATLSRKDGAPFMLSEGEVWKSD